MNFVLIAHKNEIPQWKQCNYDLYTLSNLRKFIKKWSNILTSIQKLQNCKTTNSKKTVIIPKCQKIEKIIKNSVEWYYRYFKNEQRIVSNFVQYKIYQIQQKYQQYYQIIDVVKYKSSLMLMLIQNLYIESYYLQHMAEFNIQIEINLSEKFQICLQKINGCIQYQQCGYQQIESNKMLQRMTIQCSILNQQIQHIYIADSIFNNKSQTPDDYLQREQHKKIRKFTYQSLFLGLTMGGLLAFIVILIMINVVNNIVLGENEVFTNNFPVWRGAAQLLFFIWILGLDILLFQKTSMNFKLIFYHQKFNLPHSKLFFQFAAALSFIYLILFMFFILQIANTLPTNFIYYGQVFWLFIIFWFLNPFPILYSKGRFFIMRMLCKVICSFFYPMNFLMIWISQQIVSLSQVFTDFFFTIVFFITKDYSKTKPIIQNVNSAVVLTIFLYRMYQNLKFWHQISQARPDKHYDFLAPPFLGFVRAFFGFCTGVTAIIYRLKLFTNAFVLWLVIAIISTLVAWYVDVRGDWGLLVHEHSTFLRTKLLFQRYRKFYYFFIVFNLALRTAWALNISYFVVYSTGVWPNFFVMLFSFAEIFRRGVWNFFRIENQHIKNCLQYQATVKDEHILKKVKQQIKQLKQQRCKNELAHQQNGASSVRITINDMIPISDTKLISENHINNNSHSNTSRKFHSHNLNEVGENYKQMDKQLTKFRVKAQFKLFTQLLRMRDQFKQIINKQMKQNMINIDKIVKQLTFIDFFKQE